MSNSEFLKKLTKEFSLYAKKGLIPSRVILSHGIQQVYGRINGVRFHFSMLTKVNLIIGFVNKGELDDNIIRCFLEDNKDMFSSYQLMDDGFSIIFNSEMNKTQINESIDFIRKLAGLLYEKGFRTGCEKCNKAGEFSFYERESEISEFCDECAKKKLKKNYKLIRAHV